MLTLLSPLLLLAGTFATVQWAIPAGYAFLIGVISCLPLLALTNRKVEIKKKYPWSEAAKADDGPNLQLGIAATAFLAFLAIEYVSNDGGTLPLRLSSSAQFPAGAALSISISLLVASVRERHAIKRQFP